MRFLAIILLSVAAAVGYGIVHDQITARICVEYFTVGHPPVFHTSDPTLLGLGWAHTASYAIGFLGGIWLITRTIRRRRATGPGAGWIDRNPPAQNPNNPPMQANERGT